MCLIYVLISSFIILNIGEKNDLDLCAQNIENPLYENKEINRIQILIKTEIDL